MLPSNGQRTVVPGLKGCSGPDVLRSWKATSAGSMDSDEHEEDGVKDDVSHGWREVL